MMILHRSALLLLAVAHTVQGGYYANRYDDDAANDDQQQEVAGNSSAAESDNYQDDWVASNQNVDDDMFHWSDQVGFDGVSIMPVSCVNYNNGHMIKFSFFNSDSSYQCHFDEIGTFVVSIAHYMRAYFNYQALQYGQQFYLPSDAGYLNCVQLKETENSDYTLYAKIGCQDRETFTSTKLALKVYTDAQCSEPFDDEKTTRYHSSKGYNVNGTLISSSVSFRPPFYNCNGCQPDQISDTFNLLKVSWYDDDYISQHGEKQEYEQEEDDDDEEEQNQQGNQQDDYFNDDFADDYFKANDDINNQNYYNKNNQNRYLAEEKSLVRSALHPRQAVAAEGQLEGYEKEFWQEIEEQQRQLYDNNYDIGEWNLCQRVYKYGLWCDEECRSLDQFRTDLWSGADIILLSLICTFLAGMLLLIVAKRLKAAEKSRRFSQRGSMPGLPPLAMLALFVCIMIIIAVLAELKFVNETLVFAVVTCVLVFIYMLKLTLFDNTRKPVLLAAANSDWDFDNRMDERLY